ncbi:MAG: hypothetical protein U0521_22975 [Anaerolineae bacterium]
MSVDLPPGADPDIFDLYGWDGSHWQFLPAHFADGKLAAVVDDVPEQVALFRDAARSAARAGGLR